MSGRVLVLLCAAGAVLLPVIYGAPAAGVDGVDGTDGTDGVDGDPDELHDQRQNGTENYRINMKGFAVIVSPVQALLSAASSLLEYESLAALGDLGDLQYKSGLRAEAAEAAEPAARPSPPNRSRWSLRKVIPLLRRRLRAD